MTPEEISAALYKIITDDRKALDRGLRDRERIRQCLERGERPFGHRVDWLENTAHALNRTMGEQIKLFNAQHPGDRISVSDMLDALATLMNKYRNAK